MEFTMTLDVCHVLCDLWRIAAAPAIFYATTFATNFYRVLCSVVESFFICFYVAGEA